MEALADWILERPFIKKIVYTRLFKQATDDVLETFNEDVETRADELAKQKLNDLLAPVDLKSIVSLDKKYGIIYIGGEKADQGMLGNLKSEAEYLVSTNLWKLLQETPKELAQRGMFVGGESLDDIVKGKSILYTLSTQKNIVDILLSYQQKGSGKA